MTGAAPTSLTFSVGCDLSAGARRDSSPRRSLLIPFLASQNRTHVTYDYVASRNSSVIQSNTLYKEHHFGGAADNAPGKNKDAKDGGKKAPKINIRQSIDF